MDWIMVDWHWLWILGTMILLYLVYLIIKSGGLGNLIETLADAWYWWD